MLSDIKIRSFTGRALKPYLSSMARLRLEIFRDYPYLYDGEIEEELEHLRKHLLQPEAIGVIAFDGATMIGASTGRPFHSESDWIKKPFEEQGMDPEHYFYLGKSFLLKEYRSRGIGHHFFDIREEHAQSLGKFQHLCFCSVEREEDHPKKPQDGVPLEDFWRRRGYVHRPELSYHVSWKDIEEEDDTEKKMVFWTKNLREN